MSKPRITGTGVALATPFRSDGSIDFKSLSKLVNHVIEGGVEYLVVLGTTGETPVLSKDEKLAVVDFVLECNNGRVPVVLGIGGNHTSAVLDSLKSTKTDGIEAILSVSPYYNKPNQEGIFQHFRSVAETSPLPVVIYNVPGRTGSNIAAETCLRLARDFRGQIIGVKEASGNIPQVMAILKDKPVDFHVISGDDALTFPIISLGGSGVISVVANAYAREFSDMVRYALSGNYAEARKLHYKLLPMIDAMFAEGSPAGLKAFLNAMGIIPNNLRLPLVPVSKELGKKIEHMVKTK
jgi:4-hydroxy-tetrahydrodipicolinate synthase